MISVWLLFLCLLSLKWIVVNYLSLCHNSKTVKFKCLTITFTVCMRLIPLNPTCWRLLLGYGEVVAREGPGWKVDEVPYLVMLMLAWVFR